MNKTNYELKFLEIVNNLSYKPKLLLHSCCAPCSSATLKRVMEFFDVTVIYYNPNIYPKAEYQKRKDEQLRLLKKLSVDFFDCDYNYQDFSSQVEGLEKEPEGGKRCNKCFLLRLEYVAQKAKELNFEYFGTTLTISPHKNEQVINQIGEILESNYKTKYFYSNFKKNKGIDLSLELKEKYNIYAQNYCGCEKYVKEK